MAQHDKFAVVTGASSGIGYELARVFAENGYDLLVTSGSEKIETAAPDFSGLGVEVKTVEADLSTYDGVEKLWAEIQSTGRQLTRSQSTLALAPTATSRAKATWTRS